MPKKEAFDLWLLKITAAHASWDSIPDPQGFVFQADPTPKVTKGG